MADQDTKFLLGIDPEYPVRFSYLYVFSPVTQTRDDGTESKTYSVQLIWSKKDLATKKVVDAAVAAAIKAEWGAKAPPNLKLPVRDGDEEWEEKGAHLKGMWFMNASTVRKPEVVGVPVRDELGNTIFLGPSQIRSGDYGRATCNMYAFKGKNKGVAVGLRNIQKTLSGPALDGSSTAEEDFSEFSDDDGFSF